MIDWILKEKVQSKADVSVRVHGDKKNGARVAFLFDENSKKKITTTGYAIVGLDNENCRVYFAESTNAKGYKMVQNSTSPSSRATITIKCNPVEWYKREGDYNLLHDSNGYYIDVAIKTPR